MKLETNNLIIDGIKTLLDVSPLYGNIVMHLVREIDYNEPNPLTLRWQHHQWYLVINPELVAIRFRNHNQVAAALSHEALHIIWQHPIRYAEIRQNNKMVDLGTDLAVNQYLPNDLDTIPDAITFQTINELYHLKLPEYQDSATYITLLSEATKNNQKENQPNRSSHVSWTTANESLDEAKAALKSVIKKATEDTKYFGRGEVASQVVQQLNEVILPKRHWKSLLRMGLSQTPDKKNPSRARFNRRQAYRLDLLGEIRQYSVSIVIFIDNSASISNRQASEFLANVRQITKQIDARIRIFSFDTQVHEVKNIKLWQRHAGGGTTFQIIFDTLILLKYSPLETMVVILTDGDGEKSIIQTKFKQVYWLLPAGKKLSILAPFGKVITL
ncbi:hypothetical protein GCM10025879_07010 [Leuconostoc litchii]|uniref:Peptidase n=1 Tax=Leuconostoc litchii TaxID=1981069 RepID=A0A6P2CN18_9LACO|nr:VWA-like domain-containing protein [Leuconostoc litchii]TYC47438.1 peptidase [Leuconostoc litchii]GMA69455.1 hypothetical protein GCM10025879_07010 [Leuconostoc litchii]